MSIKDIEHHDRLHTRAHGMHAHADTPNFSTASTQTEGYMLEQYVPNTTRVSVCTATNPDPSCRGKENLNHPTARHPAALAASCRAPQHTDLLGINGVLVCTHALVRGSVEVHATLPGGGWVSEGG